MRSKIWRTRRRDGFTIVELLIVIVVVAILAAITIVAYNGVQQRATASRTISTAETYVNALRLYITQYGAYPITFNACLGDTNPDTNGDSIGDCGTDGNTNQSNTLNTELKKVISTLPNANFLTITEGANKITGMRYNWGGSSRFVDDKQRPLMIIYYLQGSEQDCVLGDVARDLGNSRWQTGAKYTYSTAAKTSCYVSIPGPSET